MTRLLDFGMFKRGENSSNSMGSQVLWSPSASPRMASNAYGYLGPNRSALGCLNRQGTSAIRGRLKHYRIRVLLPDGKQVLTGSWDNARIWDTETGRPFRRFEGHSDRVESVCFSPDGKRVLTGSLDKTACLWDAETGKELQRFLGHSQPVTSVCFSPDGKQVLTGSWDHTARI